MRSERVGEGCGRVVPGESRNYCEGNFSEPEMKWMARPVGTAETNERLDEILN